MRRIKLTKSRWATVEEFYEELSAIKWHYNKGYAVRNVRKNGKRTTQGMHQYLFELLGVTIPPGFEIDHKNGRRCDNRLCNLRLVTRSQNQMNSRKRSYSTSGIKGVVWHKQACKWHSQIIINGRRIHLGLFNSKRQAALAYRAAANKHFGEFARHNSRSNKHAA